MGTYNDGGEMVAQRRLPVRRYNQRMARRITRRAKLGEDGVVEPGFIFIRRAQYIEQEANLAPGQ